MPKSLSIVLILITLLASSEAFYYLITVNDYQTTKISLKPEVIFILPAGEERIEYGFDLINRIRPLDFAVIGNDRAAIDKFWGNFKFPLHSRLILAGKSGSTTEDLINIKKTAEKYNHKSIIIISSLYHIPRVKFLSKFILSEKIKFEFIGVAWKNNPDNGLIKKCGGIKIIIRELIQIYTSSAQLIYHHIRKAYA